MFTHKLETARGL